MCGRYTLTTDLSAIQEHFGITTLPPGMSEQWQPRYNMAPGQKLPVILPAESGRELRLMRWGLIPSWADDPSIGYKMINARSETASEKPAFKRAFLARRCIIPADSFYEWKKSGKEKQPLRILRPNRQPFGLAGLWEEWRSPEGELLESFTILTTEANQKVRPVHERMPVILPKTAQRKWLDPRLRDAGELNDLLHAPPDDLLEIYPVSTLVNAAKNDVPECVVPIAEQRDLFG